MRPIKFRGLDVVGKWYFGLLAKPLHDVGGAKKGHAYISNAVGMPFAYEVRPETVGQSTGLHDKNGKEIYEGDIVNFNLCGYALEGLKKSDINIENLKNKRSKIYWCSGGYWAIELWIGGIAPIQHWFGNYPETEIEIIGDIYSNPELLNHHQRQRYEAIL